MEACRDKMLKKNNQKHGDNQKTIDDPVKISLDYQYRHNIPNTKILVTLELRIVVGNIVRSAWKSISADLLSILCEFAVSSH